MTQARNQGRHDNAQQHAQKAADYERPLPAHHLRPAGVSNNRGNEPTPDSGGQHPAANNHHPNQDDPSLTAVNVPPAPDIHSPRTSTATNHPLPLHQNHAAEDPALTTVDRYYLAWINYQTTYGSEPTARQLSTYLHDQGIHGRKQGPVNPSTLRRYLLPFRLYTIWSEQRAIGDTPSPEAIAQECANRGIAAQHNKPVTTHYISDRTRDFERRWKALAHHHTPDGR
ncbi:hypothetical protein [Streptomyces cadmiisoli]|uniref:hypothetical protein n=1 Tax=Streptomyces cadmiisoli TaxID=2184053 RepID=UPI0036677E87